MPDKSERIERIRRETRFTFILFLTFGTLMTGSALADRVFGLGWGFGPWDALAGLGIMLGGCLVYLCCIAIYRVTAWVWKGH